MQYITHKRFRGKTLSGEVNLSAKTLCSSEDGFIFHNGKPICLDTSENAHQYFARNDDGNGMERGELTQSIQKTLAKRDTNHQKRWDKVWEDERCQKYKRMEHADYWLWNHEFFNAPIEDLRYVNHMVRL